MISFWADRPPKNGFSKKNPLSFFTNLFKRKKFKVERYGNINNVNNSRSAGGPRVPSTLSVSVTDMRMSSPYPLSPSLSTLTLTPGRTRDIDLDMETLRLSRQDNPYLQVLASRESLVESNYDAESDDTNLMCQEYFNDLEVDPLSLPEIHEHMIRSPPPTTWPKSPNFKVFKFPPPGADVSVHVGKDTNQLGCMKSPGGLLSPRQSNYKLFDHFGAHISRPSGYRPHQRSISECRHRTSQNLVCSSARMRSLSDVRRGQHAEERHTPFTLPLARFT